jgi:hypothetical protein
LTEASDVVRKLRAVAEPAARVALLAEMAATAEADTAVRVLQDIGVQALAREPIASELVLSLMAPKHGFTDARRCTLLADLAREREAVVALQWLWAANEARAAAQERESADTQGLVDRALASMTLGDRRALARRATRDQLLRLVGDPDPMVVTHVLNNPRVTESNVLAMCSKRPTVTAALETVIEAPTWSRRLAIRVALAHNPHLAVRAAVPLLVTLPAAAIGRLRDDEAISPSLRLAASRLLEATRATARTS